MSKGKGFCYYYCLLISIFGCLFLTYIALLCAFDVKELDVEDKTEYTGTVFISAGVYEVIVAILVIYGFITSRRAGNVSGNGYQRIEDEK
ncbi:unnamed protein product [Blepharisma stoltei]|uniref:Uncharacterized protein n=1 Tax=Blepharisma stoltei TaxID=1481888 RepID=A0AAU9KC73_9CILI|nr:unnamed protein product [Blepharisma stoltei]